MAWPADAMTSKLSQRQTYSVHDAGLPSNGIA
jgi:hypothetical protein